MTTTQTATIRAGDAVRHIKSGEQWLVAAVDRHGCVYAAGWPETMANPNEVELVERCTDEAHAEMLYQCARSQGLGRRRSLALTQLTMAMGRGQRVPPDIASEIIGALKNDVERSVQSVEMLLRTGTSLMSFWSGTPRWLPADSSAALHHLGSKIEELKHVSASLHDLFVKKNTPTP